MNKDECFVVKDLVKFYGMAGLEGETKEWVNQHLSTCEQCGAWIKTAETSTEDKRYEEIFSTQEEQELIKKVQWTFRIGIGIILLLGAWVSFWLLL